MGIVAKQTLKGSLWSYLGVIIGALNVAILMPRIFSQDQIGMINIIIAISAVLAQFSTLGLSGVSNKFFPYFFNKEKKHNGYLFLTLMVALCGFLISWIIYYFLKDSILSSKSDDNILLLKYSYYIIPMSLFTLLFLILDKYNTVLFNSVQGTFLKEFGLRIFNLLFIILFFYNVINFSQFTFLYFIAYLLIPIVLVIILLMRGDFTLKMPEWKLFKLYRSQMVSVAIYTVFSGFGIMVITYIDKFMINYYLGLSQTGVYSICAFVATLLLISYRSLTKVTVPLVADAWKRNDKDYLQSLYLKSSKTQLMFGIFLFILIWSNINNIFHIFPESYKIGEWSIFYLCFANIIVIYTSISDLIIQTSERYRFSSYLIYILIGLVIIFNIIFIPLYGMTGAAFASFIAITLNSIIKVIYIKYKFGISQFNYRHLYIVLIGIVVYFVAYIIPEINQFILDIILRSSVITISFWGLIYICRIEPQMNTLLNDYIKNIFHNE